MEKDIQRIRKVWGGPLMPALHANDRERVKKAFSILIGTKFDNVLSLNKYLDNSPERFYSKEAYEVYTEILDAEFSRDPELVIRIFNENCDEIDRAFSALDEVARKKWHDGELERDDYAFMRDCDQLFHPDYLKLSESVLQKVLYPLACLFRMKRNKSIQDLWKLSKCVDEILYNNHSALVKSCDSRIRNSIAHGQIRYKQQGVEYIFSNDKKVEMGNGEIVRFVDELMDVCQGCALALKIFFRRKLSIDLAVPRYILLEELQEEVKFPWWSLKGCLVSELSDKKQLVIYAEPLSFDKLNVGSSRHKGGASFWATFEDRKQVGVFNAFSVPAPFKSRDITL